MNRYPGRGIHGQIVEAVGAAIVAGRFQSGQLLYADDLTREFGVSRTVIREALKVLAAKGLVESRPKRGTIVLPREAWSALDSDLLEWRMQDLDASFLRDLHEVRFIVEPEGASLAAQRRTAEDLAQLEATVERMRAAGHDGEAIIEADLAFHRALLTAAHNELLMRLEAVIEVGLRARDRLVHGAEDWRDSVAEHQAILDAVAGQDAAGAAAATRQLLTKASADIPEREPVAERR